MQLAGVDNIVEDPLISVRNPLHRVCYVLVEARKEAKSVFAGQVSSAADARARDVDASGLTPGMACRSYTVTLKPRSASSWAALMPPTPPPSTATLRPGNVKASAVPEINGTEDAAAKVVMKFVCCYAA